VSVADANFDDVDEQEDKDDDAQDHKDESDDGGGETSIDEFSSEDLGTTKPKKRKTAELEDSDDFKSPSTQLKKSNSLGKTTKSPKSPHGNLAPPYSFFTLNFR